MNQNGFNSLNQFDGPVFIEGDTEIEGNLDVTGTINGGSGGGITNPLTADIDGNNKNLLFLNDVHMRRLYNNTYPPANYIDVYGILRFFSSWIDMQSSPIYSVNSLTCSLNNIPIHLDLVPLSSGTANQVLSRDPNYDPNNTLTHRLVWQTISGSGGVSNPLTSNLNCNNFNLTNVNTISGPAINSTVTIIDDKVIVEGSTETRVGSPFGVVNLSGLNTVITTSGSNPVQCHRALNMSGNIINNVPTIEMSFSGSISSSLGTQPTSIFWAQPLKVSSAPFYQQFNTTYITPIDAQGVIIDSKLPGGLADSSITLSAPIININNSTNLAPSVLNTQNIHINGTLQGDNMQIRSDLISAGVFTPITIQASTTSIYGITEHFNNVKMVNNDIVDVKDLQFNTGFIIPSSMGPGIKDQILTTDGKNAKWEYGSKIPYKLWDGVVILPVTTTPQDISAGSVGKFRGSNTFPANYFQNGNVLDIKIRGHIDSGSSGNNIISIFFNNIQHITFTCQTISSGGVGVSAFSADITLVARIGVNNIDLSFQHNTCTYMQNKTGQNAVPPQCMLGDTISAGTQVNIINTVSVRFSQSSAPNTQIKVFTMVYEIN